MVYCLISVYSCFDKGCPTKAYKRSQQCRLVLWVERVWRWLIEVYGVNQQEKERHKYIYLCCFPLCPWNTQSLNQGPWTPVTHNIFPHCRVRFCWTTFLETVVYNLAIDQAKRLPLLNNNIIYTTFCTVGIYNANNNFKTAGLFSLQHIATPHEEKAPYGSFANQFQFPSCLLISNNI